MQLKFEGTLNSSDDNQLVLKVDRPHTLMPDLEAIYPAATGETCSSQDSFTILDNNHQVVQIISNIKNGQFESKTQPGVPVSHATLEQINNGDISFVTCGSVVTYRSEAQLAKEKQGSLAESCQFFIDCFNQSIMLPIEFVKEMVDFFSDPCAYSANLAKECPSYTLSGNWNRIQGGNNRNQFFAGSTNASLCQQIASSSLPQIGQ